MPPQGLTDEQRTAVASILEEERFSDGEAIVREGDIADSLFFIKWGEAVAVRLGRCVPTITLGTYAYHVNLTTSVPCTISVAYGTCAARLPRCAEIQQTRSSRGCGRATCSASRRFRGATRCAWRP